MNDEKAVALKEASPLRAVSPFGEMERLFDRLLARRGWLRPLRADWPVSMDLDWAEVRVPRVDVLDREDDLQLKIEVPGMDKKDIDISVGEDSVTVKGEVEREDKEEAGDYVRCEIARGAFSRTIALPAAVDGSRARAVFKDGLLTLTLPKVERARRHAVRVE
jgi:HSP20 family protein